VGSEGDRRDAAAVGEFAEEFESLHVHVASLKSSCSLKRLCCTVLGGLLEESYTSNVASVPGHSISSERHLVFILIAILLVAVVSIAALVVEVHRDGYRQIERRNLVRIF
jgi:hypothetical protein